MKNNDFQYLQIATIYLQILQIEISRIILNISNMNINNINIQYDIRNSNMQYREYIFVASNFQYFRDIDQYIAIY